MTARYPQPDRPLLGPAAWRADGLAADEWVHEWTARERRELEGALGRAGFPLAGTGVGRLLNGVLDELLRGRGFVLLRGLDVARYELADVAAIFRGIGAYLGRALPQNARGHLLGHVTDLGRDAADPTARIYQTNARQGWHTDSADVVGLLCLQPAVAGGRSALASAAAIHNELLERCPELLAELFGPFCTDHRGEAPPGAPPFFTAPVLSWFAGELSVLYQRRYIESAQRFAEVPPLTARQVAALDAFDAAADDPRVHVEMELRPGDIQLVHNHGLVHDRTAFRDDAGNGRRRHLLRLWLCPEDGRPLPAWFAERLGSTQPGARGGIRCDGVEPRVTLDPLG